MQYTDWDFIVTYLDKKTLPHNIPAADFVNISSHLRFETTLATNFPTVLGKLTNLTARVQKEIKINNHAHYYALAVQLLKLNT